MDSHTDKKWLAFSQQLHALGYQTKLFALPGLTAPLDEVWSLDDYVAWLDRQLLGKRDVILLGHSFGGQLAIRYASTHQRQIRNLILIDSSGMRDWALKARVKRAGFWVAAKVGKVFFNAPWARTLLYKVARERDYMHAPPLLRRTMSLILDEEVIDAAPTIKARTLIVWGEQDRVTPLKIGRRFASLIPNSHLEIVTGARHSPQYTHAKATARIIHAWLQGLGTLQ